MKNPNESNIPANDGNRNPEGLRIYCKGDFSSEDFFDLTAETYHVPVDKLMASTHPPFVTDAENDETSDLFYDFL